MLKIFFFKISILSGFVLCVLTGGVSAAGHNPLSHGPIGIMGDHFHGSGEWMFSYRFMRMNMEGNRSGQEPLSSSQVIAQGYMVSPLKMEMDMHMLGAMYGFSNDLTLMVMLPYMRKSMDHITMSSVKFTTDAQGLGDTRVTVIKAFHQTAQQKGMINAGLSFPTGSIDRKDDTPMGSNQQLPYPMQLGSGTTDLLLGITYTDQAEKNAWGAQVKGTFRFGENSRGYRLGNEYQVTSWWGFFHADWISSSIRLNGLIWDNIAGSDSALNPNMVATADPLKRGGQRWEVALGINLISRGDFLKGHRIAFEWGIPFYQNLQGPQLETDWTFTLGWQYAL